jgi:hypothetical protein
MNPPISGQYMEGNLPDARDEDRIRLWAAARSAPGLTETAPRVAAVSTAQHPAGP